MKIKNYFNKYLLILISIIVLNSCAVTVPFSYTVQKSVVSEKKLTSNVPINFVVTDKRPEPDIIGYMQNAYGMRMKKIKTTDLDISKTILIKYQEELGKLGFVISEKNAKCPLKLEFTITSFLGEMRDGAFIMETNATCCMRILLTTENEKNTLMKGSVCGKGEKKTPIIAGKKDIPAALSIAVDDVFSKIINNTELINTINNYKR